MISAPHVEAATLADLDALAALRVEQGWRRSDILLRAILSWERGRVFVIRAGALGGASGASELSPVVTTAAIAAGPVGVVGNVIVHADYRRRGLGRVIMEASLAWLRDQGVRRVLLDATEDGRPLYTRLGFVPITRSWHSSTPITAFNRAALRERAERQRATLRPASDLARLAALDRAATGADRMDLLRLTLQSGDCRLYVADDDDGAPLGYLVARPLEAPAHGMRLGPWIATAPAVAAALLDACLSDDFASPDAADANESHASLSLPGTSQEALALLAAVGATMTLDDVVMQLDFASQPAIAEPHTPLSAAEQPSWLYSWLSPMTF